MSGVGPCHPSSRVMLEAHHCLLMVMGACHCASRVVLGNGLQQHGNVMSPSVHTVSTVYVEDNVPCCPDSDNACHHHSTLIQVSNPFPSHLPFSYKRQPTMHEQQ